MKALSLSTMALLVLVLLSFNNVHAHATSGSVLFMKTNSTAKIYTDFTFRVLNNETWNLNPQILTSSGSDLPAKDLTIVATPNSFTGNKNHVNVTYTITAKGDAKGTYALFLYLCGSYPLVIGLNESEINPSSFRDFFSAVYSCPAIIETTPYMNIDNYSGIISKTMTINANNTLTVNSQNTTNPNNLSQPPRLPSNVSLNQSGNNGTVSPALQILQPSSPLWSDLLVGMAHSVSMSDDGQYVAVGTENGKSEGHVYLYDNSGNLMWNYKADRKIASTAISRDGSYVAAGGYQILDNGAGSGYGYNAWYANPALYFFSNNGTLLWKYESGGRQTLWNIAMPYDGTFVITNIDGNIMSFDRKGNLLWNYTSGDDIGNISISFDGHYLVTNTADHVLYLDDTGKLLWSSEIDPDENARSLISQDGRYVLVSSSEPGSGNGKLYLFDNRGNLLWEKTVDGSLENFVMSDDDYYIAESSTSTKLLDLKGNTVWDFNSTTDRMAISHGDSYVAITGNVLGQENVIAHDPLGNNIFRFPLRDQDISQFSTSLEGSYLSFATSEPQSGSSTLYYFKVVPNATEQSDTKPTVIPSLLEQLRSGIAPGSVICNKGLELVFKAEDSSPACLSPQGAAILVERGWGKAAYYHVMYTSPKVTLSDYMYNGIEKDENTTISIDNQTYYQTTLDYSAYNLPEKTPMKFQNVTFSFPEGTMPTPGGAFVTLDMKFTDGTEESYGTHATNELGGIPVPTQYGLHLAVNSTTVLSNHVKPQAGITIYHDKIKLLVSMDNSTYSESSTNQTSPSSLQISLSTNSSSIQAGKAIGIEISLNNTSSHLVTLPLQSLWPMRGLSLGGCSYFPDGISILEGYYTEQNMSSANPLPLFLLPPCAPGPFIKSFTFEPMSSNVTVQCEPSGFYCPGKIETRSNLAYSGFLENNDRFHIFDPGNYTLVGGDEWGHVAVRHFVVTNSTGN